MRFPTKVDWWILVSVLMAPLGIGVAAIATKDPMILWSLAGVVAIMGALCWPCDYTFAEDALVIRSGLIKWKVPYAAIDRAEPTNNPLSAPAWSLDRVAIVYGKKSILISPVRQDEFLTELRVKATLTREGSSSVYTRRSG